MVEDQGALALDVQRLRNPEFINVAANTAGSCGRGEEEEEGGRGGRALELDRGDVHRREESEVSALSLGLSTRKYSAQVTVAAEMACSSLGASTTLVAGVCSSSSINGQKLSITSARPVSVRAPSRVGAVTAKYGEKSVYFDLGDISNTTGKWDLYGNDEPNRYNGLQSKFFETFGGVFSKRGLLLKFLVLGWATSIGYFGSTAAGDLLPIKKGPQQPPVIGPRDRI